jgi:ADP-heptose:LPS heptosyltransferase
VTRWHPGDPAADVDLDRFRGVLFRGFEGNYVQAYHLTFGLPFNTEDLQEPWLEADPKRIAPIVINRTFRYRCPDGTGTWQNLLAQANIVQNGIFVGNEDEHEDFVRLTGFNIDRYPVQDFKELADVIAGADLFMGNQSAAYSIAMGLGKSSVLETINITK